MRSNNPDDVSWAVAYTGATRSMTECEETLATLDTDGSPEIGAVVSCGGISVRNHFKDLSVDRAVFIIWTLIVLMGQIGLNQESTILQWVAVFWMGAGILLVRKSSCLPFILMTMPVFMCEIHRPWAWSQVAMTWIFLLRILMENHFSRHEYLGVALTAVIIVCLSCPADAVERLMEILDFSPHEILWQWFHPEASWAVFAFRQTADRALIAGLTALIVIRGAYFSTHRVIFAMTYVCVMALIAGFGAGLLPWQEEPHPFLGTTNFASWGSHLFQGAGYNIHYLVFLLVAGFPWLCRPLYRERYGWIHGFLGLCVPLIWIRQRALALALLGMALLALFFRIRLRLRKGPSNNVAKIRQRPHNASNGRFLPVFIACFCVSLLWMLNMGITDSTSELNRQFKEIYIDKVFDTETSELVSPAEVVRQQAAKAPRLRVWRYALAHVWSNHLLRGAGAGTWAPFHREHRLQIGDFPRYWAHTHNTYIDILFEYGIIPALLLFTLTLCGLYGIAKGMIQGGRLWLLYFAGISMLALGQHLFYAFTMLCGLLPAFILTGRACHALLGNKITLWRGSGVTSNSH